MKLALITDTHFGIRGDSAVMLDHQKTFFENIFFPTILEEDITHIVHLGDLVDRRKYINFNTLSRMKTDFLDKLVENNITMDIILGNHDVFYKSTNSLNALTELLGSYKDYINVIDSPTETDYGICIPWINAENEKNIEKSIKKTKQQILFGHLELKGFEMFRGQICDHGQNIKIFDKFDMVFSGHFHHKSHKENIYYLGAPYQMTWSDHGCDRGFYIFETDNRELQFIPNPYSMFTRITYNDAGATDATESLEYLDSEQHKITNAYIKIVVQTKDNPYWFDQFVTKIESFKPIDIRIIESIEFNEDNSYFVDETQDTRTILLNTIDKLDITTDKTKLKKLMSSLYTEALNIEVDA